MKTFAVLFLFILKFVLKIYIIIVEKISKSFIEIEISCLN